MLYYHNFIDIKKHLSKHKKESNYLTLLSEIVYQFADYILDVVILKTTLVTIFKIRTQASVSQIPTAVKQDQELAQD